MRTLLRKAPLTFIATSYLFSWTFWLLAWILAQDLSTGLLYNEALIRGVLFDSLSIQVLLVSFLSLVGVYGPLVGGVLATAVDGEASLRDLAARTLKIGIARRWYLSALAILLVAWLGPLLILLAANGLQVQAQLTTTQLLTFLASFLVFQLITSGTEEVGWRGYLLPKVLPGRSLWDAGWLVGIVWAVWHFPIVIMLFIAQGMTEPVQIIGSLAGFSIGIVAMSMVHTWFYVRTRSVFLAILIHASFNTLPLTTGMLFADAYLGALLSQLALWAIVIYLMRPSENAPRAVEAGPQDSAVPS